MEAEGATKVLTKQRSDDIAKRKALSLPLSALESHAVTAEPRARYAARAALRPVTHFWDPTKAMGLQTP